MGKAFSYDNIKFPIPYQSLQAVGGPLDQGATRARNIGKLFGLTLPAARPQTGAATTG